MMNITTEIEAFIRSGIGRFEDLALKLFAYQFENNKPYQAFCQAQGMTPANVRQWQEIPAIPINAFKTSELTTCPPLQAAAVFHSSATTTGTPSRHFLKELVMYERSLRAQFQRWVLPDSRSMPFLILTPSPAEASRSSLAWMMDVVKRQWGAPGSQYFIRQGRLDELWLSTMLAKASGVGEPVVLLGTTLAFLTLFDWCKSTGKQFQLPAGSRLMDTGGLKGQKREVTRPEFIQLVQMYLGIPEDQCINEYGMCEMSSQFYGKGKKTRLEGPPWVRTRVIDVVSGVDAKSGESGLLRHYDLANIDSVMAIQTDDLGKMADSGFELLGRAPGAVPKGCSLEMERAGL